MHLFIAAILLLPIAVRAATLKHESEVSILSAGGNTELETYNSKTSNRWQFDKNAFNLGGHYTYGEATGALSARNWDANSKYEFGLTERLSAIIGETIEGNRFQDVKVRYNSDGGLKYILTKSERQDWFFEGAYRYTVEDRYSTENVYQHKARTYTEWNRKQSETTQWRLWLEYLPNFSAGSDWMLTGEASFTNILNSTFSLKIAYKGLYDNLPAAPGLKNYDYLTTTSLVAKF
jgi:putative salt-induced outer membrane protein YdiY